MAVFTYAGRLLTSRPTLWVAALACAALWAVPGAVVATLLVQPVTMLLLTGDPALALATLPDELSGTWFLASLALGALVLGLAFNRFYAVLLWESDEERTEGWRSAWRSTRGVWMKLVALNLAFLLVLVVATGALVLLTALALAVSSGAATLTMLLGATFLLALRTIGKIAVTLAARSILLDRTSIRDAWRTARSMLRERRRQVVAAWASLLALGVAVWIGGRLVTPILQDTALDFPVLSEYTFAREAAQLLFAIPLEAFVLVIASAVWTAVFRGIDFETAPTSSQPFAARALAVLVVLVIIGNGIPAVIDVAWRNDEERRERAVRAREITPEDALVDASMRRVGDVTGDEPSYDVHARLEDDELTWSTTIRYRSTGSQPLEELPLYVYPAAFTGEVEELPLAEDLLSIPRGARGDLEPGTFEVVRVIDRSGNELEWDLTDTLLRVHLDDPTDGELLKLEIELRAELPTWPLRYGVWDGVVQLGNWIPTVPVWRHDGFVIHPYGDIGDPFLATVSDYTVEIEAEDGIGVVGTGQLTQVRSAGDRSVWRFEAPETRDAAFAAGDALRGLELDAGPTVRTWYNGEDSLTGARIAEDAAAAVRFYTPTFGSLQTSEIDVVSIQNPLGGMEYPGLVYVSSGFSQLEGLPLLPELVDHSGFQDEQERYVAGHELAHQWWFAEVGNDQVEEPWLDEGFAEASTRLWLQSEDGNERTWKIAHLENEATLAGNIGAGVTAFDDNSDYSDAVYDSGGELLMELRSLIGAESYDELMARWHFATRGEVGTIEEFIDLTERIVGAEARALLERYLK